MYVDDIKLAGKKQNINPTWKILMKDVDLGEPTSFLDHVFLGCTQRKCRISKDIVANYRDMFESTISAGAKEKLIIRVSGKFDAEKNELTELLWIGCLTGLIWTPRFKSVTLTPNIDSQTF